MTILKRTPDVKELAWLIWDDYLSSKNMKALANGETMTEPNDLEKEIYEELMCGHLTVKDIQDAVKLAKQYLDDYLDYCEKTGK